MILLALMTAGTGVGSTVFYSDSTARGPHDAATNSTFATTQFTNLQCHLGVSANGLAGKPKARPTSTTVPAAVVHTLGE